MDFPRLLGYLSRVKFPATLVCVLAGLLICARPAKAIVNGQIDTFEDLTSDFWGYGFGDWAVKAGGPGGVNDHYLEVLADGNGQIGRFVAFNRNQWLGNYTLAGVNAIEMDLKAFSIVGATTLTIRIAFRSSTAMGSPGYVTTVGFTIAADGQWHHAVFNFSSFVPIGSPPPLATLLANPAELRIINAVNPNTILGDNLAGVLGIDNIHAIPEPGSIVATAVLALAAAVIGTRWRRNSKFEIRSSK